MWKIEEIRTLLIHDDRLIRAAVLALYDFQSPEEKKAKIPLNKDGLGFDRYDSKKMNMIAEGLLNKPDIPKRKLNYIKDRLLKYDQQLLRLANNEFEGKESAWQLSFIRDLDEAWRQRKK